MEIGNGATDGLSTDERQTTETLWVMTASPLILGTDLTRLDSTDVAQLSNVEVLSIDQNGVPGAPVATGTQEVWRAKQPDGSYAVALFNLGSSSATVSATWSSMGFKGTATVQDFPSATDKSTRLAKTSSANSVSVTRSFNATRGKVAVEVKVYAQETTGTKNALSIYSSGTCLPPPFPLITGRSCGNSYLPKPLCKCPLLT